ncbi:MAG: ATP-dependent DNA helicase RecG [Methylacidiphilales bacterium]|nr:ATP-dependent DNA helicase RecG [Candidatus Methylacidiphilales bacterium]
MDETPKTHVRKPRAVAPVWKKLGLATAEELLFHFPRRYEDRARWLNPFEAREGESVTVRGKIATARFARWRGGRNCFEANFQPDSQFEVLQLAWYNMPFLKNYLTEGKELIIHGKIVVSGKKRKIIHPEFELVAHDANDSIHLNRIAPVYPSTSGLNQRLIRNEIYGLLFREKVHFEEIHPVPPGFKEIGEAMCGVHFPETWEQLEECRRRLAFDELLAMQVLLAHRRRQAKSWHKVRVKPKLELCTELLKSLPFEPTKAQQRVFAEVDRDLERPQPMNRMLQGDVGSGKTLVAAHTLLRALESGKNSAFLAPTETLAEQHYQNLTRLLEPLGVSVRLFTRSRKSTDAALFGRKGVVYVGTHALFQEKVELPNLGLGIIDEQHKFGVLQRQAFLGKGDHPDLLVMTATPIPRTLCLTLYGDLDISILDEMPPGRKAIRTVLRSRPELPKVWKFIRKEMALGRQAYIVYPVLEENEQSELKSVQAAFREMKQLFGDKEVVMLHGRMDADEKAEKMRAFRQKQSHVMVATSVIEVGVDVPDATLMVIEHAERFGLAQLHQLRGRVGRGDAQSYCVLVGEAKSPESWQRLKIMEETQDGFVLAEEDLNIRGPGNILGTEQSGLPPLRVANLARDLKILAMAREVAAELGASDPDLARHPELKKRLEIYWSAAGPQAAN